LHAPAPPQEAPRTPYEKPTIHQDHHREAEDAAQDHSSSSHRRQHHRHESHASESRRERSSRRHQRGESRKKTVPISQWILGGCMLAAGVIGFFVLSGDFGGTAGDAPPTDGWRQRVEDQSSSPDFQAPQIADTPQVTVHREPLAAPQAGGAWTNPAEGAIAPAPAPQPTPAGPPWINGAVMPGSSEIVNRPETTGAASSAANPNGATAAAAGPNPEGPVAAPQPQGPNPSAGVNAPAAPGGPQAQASYPSTGYSEGPIPALGPAARVGMREAAPTSGYPTTGAPQSPFPSNVTPPAMSPRYERIR
jgi:hypothetical protein